MGTGFKVEGRSISWCIPLVGTERHRPSKPCQEGSRPIALQTPESVPRDRAGAIVEPSPALSTAARPPQPSPSEKTYALDLGPEGNPPGLESPMNSDMDILVPLDIVE